MWGPPRCGGSEEGAPQQPRGQSPRGKRHGGDLLQPGQKALSFGLRDGERWLVSVQTTWQEPAVRWGPKGRALGSIDGRLRAPNWTTVPNDPRRPFRPCFADEETEAPRGATTLSRSHGQWTRLVSSTQHVAEAVRQRIRRESRSRRAGSPARWRERTRVKQAWQALGSARGRPVGQGLKEQTGHRQGECSLRLVFTRPV